MTLATSLMVTRMILLVVETQRQYTTHLCSSEEQDYLYTLSRVAQETNDGNISEPERHAHLKTRILNDLKAFGYADGSTEHDKIETLAELIVDNFDTERSKVWRSATEDLQVT